MILLIVQLWKTKYYKAFHIIFHAISSRINQHIPWGYSNMPSQFILQEKHTQIPDESHFVMGRRINIK